MTCFLKFIPVVDKDFLAGCGESHSNFGAVGRSFLAGFKDLQYAHLKAVKLYLYNKFVTETTDCIFLWNTKE